MVDCRRCGRELKNSKSIELGYGKICYEIACGKDTKKIKTVGYFKDGKTTS